MTKEQEIQALSFDKFQHLLCDNILPYLEPRLIWYAACREEEILRKTELEKYGAEGYILKFDIRKYFNSIDHVVLEE